MKRIFGLCVFLFILVAPGLVKAEAIDSFNAAVKIQPDSTIVVTETISYDFAGASRHGIFRDIPYSYKARGGNYGLRIKVLSVKDASGRSYKYSVSKSGGQMHVKIGDADVLVSGVHTYVITYEVKRAVNYFNDHDELYWNVTGQNWEVSMSNVFATVTVPEDVSADKLSATCFAGTTGSQTPCSTVSVSTSTASYAQATLSSFSGLTIVFGWPKGIIMPPTTAQKVGDIVKDNWSLVIAPLVFLYLLYRWRKYGRDASGSRVVVPEYEAPDGLTPAEAGTLVDEKADNKEITAEIIHLAVLGVIKITRIETKKLLVFKNTDYQIDLLKPYTDLPNKFQQKICEGLFDDKKTSVKISELKNKFYTTLAEVKNDLYRAVLEKGYFVKNPQTVRRIYSGIGIALAFFGLFIGNFAQSWYVGISVVVSGVLVLVFGFFMPAKTAKGVETKRKILGLKLYLSVAEKDRIRFHNAPEKSPKVFEKFLPYALALGVEEAWAKQFEDLYMPAPSWYSDPTGMRFNSLLFVHSVNSFASAATTNMSSAARGGSGFSGGGGGGGFGGGGGGSW